MLTEAEQKMQETRASVPGIITAKNLTDSAIDPTGPVQPVTVLNCSDLLFLELFYFRNMEAKRYTERGEA